MGSPNNSLCGCNSAWQLWQLWSKFGRVKDDSRSLSAGAMKWWISIDKNRKTHRHAWLFICFRHKDKNYVSLFWAPNLFVLLWRSSLVYAAEFVLPGPPSHILQLWPLLHIAARFNLPNAVMGRANQPPERTGPSYALPFLTYVITLSKMSSQH